MILAFLVIDIFQAEEDSKKAWFPVPSDAQCKDDTIGNLHRICGLQASKIPTFRDFPFYGENVRRTGCRLTTVRSSVYLRLNRYLLILRRLIFASSVESGTPSLAA